MSSFSADFASKCGYQDWAHARPGFATLPSSLVQMQNRSPVWQVREVSSWGDTVGAERGVSAEQASATSRGATSGPAGGPQALTLSAPAVRAREERGTTPSRPPPLALTSPAPERGARAWARGAAEDWAPGPGLRPAARCRPGRPPCPHGLTPGGRPRPNRLPGGRA